MQIDIITRRIDYHIVPHMGGWNVKAEGSHVIEARFTTQYEAMAYGVMLARHDAVSMIVHGRDGRIRDVRSYDNFDYDKPIIMEKETH